MHKALFGLGLFSLIACGGTSLDGDSESGSAADAGGRRATGGRSTGGGAGKAASSGEGGESTGGDAAGGNATGGNATGGSAQGGTVASGGTSATTGEGGEAGAAEGGTGTGGSGASGAAGKGGANATGGSSTGGTAGTSGRDFVCDPDAGELEDTPYPTCAPRLSTDACELCIQASCCELAKVCYGYDPGNVCGWGGPSGGDYEGLNEIDCYVQCARDYANATGGYDDGAADVCLPACTTDGCGLIGNATMDLVVCLEANCDDACFAP